MREKDSKLLNYHKPLTITEKNRLAKLEKENKELKTQNEWVEGCKSELAEHLGKANDRITELEQQIEKMKCCGNCKKEGVCDNDCAKYKDNYHEWELWNV